MGRVAGIDYGLARIGLAISDESKIIASSLDTIQAHRHVALTAQAVAQRLAPFKPELIIIGLALHFNGKEGFLADETRAFIEELKKHLTCPILTWEERLSTLQAERVLKEANLSRKKRSKVVDKMVAALLLQSYLDTLCLTK